MWQSNRVGHYDHDGDSTTSMAVKQACIAIEVGKPVKRRKLNPEPEKPYHRSPPYVAFLNSDPIRIGQEGPPVPHFRRRP